MRISDWSSDVCSSDLDGASHMLDYIFRPTIPAVQCEPAPKKGAVHNPAMTTKGAGRGDIGILSPYIFERFKPPVHHCPIDRRRQSANRMSSKRADRRRRFGRVI